MKKISDFLNQFKLSKSYEFEVKLLFIDLLKKQLNLNLNSQEIKVKNNLIYLNLNPKIKALIKLRKNLILKELNSLIKDQKVKDII